MNTPQTDPTAAVDAFTLALMASCGQLSLIIGHMHRFAAEAGAPDDARARARRPASAAPQCAHP